MDNDFADSFREFSAQAAAERRTIWACRVQLADGSRVAVAKSATKIQRVPAEQGVGWVQQARAQFNFSSAATYLPEIGAEWSIVLYADHPAEVGTRWRCIDLLRAEVGGEHVAECRRLD